MIVKLQQTSFRKCGGSFMVDVPNMKAAVIRCHVRTADLKHKLLCGRHLLNTKYVNIYYNNMQILDTV